MLTYDQARNLVADEFGYDHKLGRYTSLSKDRADHTYSKPRYIIRWEWQTVVLINPDGTYHLGTSYISSAVVRRLQRYTPVKVIAGSKHNRALAGFWVVDDGSADPWVLSRGMHFDGDGNVLPRKTDQRASVKITEVREKARQEKLAEAARRAENARQAAETRDSWIKDRNLTRRDDGTVVMYKAVSDDLRSGWPFPGQKDRALYAIGATITAPDYDPVRQCGNGLHFGATPADARVYAVSRAVRYLACAVDYDTLVPLGGKVKAKSCTVLHEVDYTGAPVLPGTEAAS